jgi:proteasome beta subunit
MTLPTYRADDDPGPSFVDLLARVGQGPRWESPGGSGHAPSPIAIPQITHGTTVVAVRYADGVVMAGDRRAIAGAAGPAMEMVKLFQLQLEHYEKVEGSELSLEGKANQLGQMVRSHLPAAMQGLAVVPLFAGYDTRRATGRLFEYDVTGGRYEESDFAATGSGSLHAGTVVKMGYSEDLSGDDAIELLISALFQAADEDSATGGPDLVRGIYPVVATISARGFTRLPDADVSARFRALLETMTAKRGNGG